MEKQKNASDMMIERTGDTYEYETFVEGVRCLERNEGCKAMYYFVASAQQGGLEDARNMIEQYLAEDTQRKVDEIKAAANAEDTRAQYVLSYLFDQGIGVEKGPLQSERWLNRAASRGLADAQLLMGRNCLYWRNEEANWWFMQAAEQGHMEAQCELAVSYASGMGVPEDMGEAIRWHTLAAEQGQTESCRMLGLLYKAGEGVEADHAKAAYWIRRTHELRGAIEEELLEWAETVEKNTPAGE